MKSAPYNGRNHGHASEQPNKISTFGQGVMASTG